MNAKDITSGAANILLVGDSGTHKTFFLGTVPGIYIFDFDKGMTILRGRDIQYDTFKDAPKDWKVTEQHTKRDGIYERGHAWNAFVKRLNEIGTLIDAGKGPKAIGLDSLTFLAEIAMNDILRTSKTTDAGNPTIASYGALLSYMKALLGQLTAWPIQLIVTAHIQRNENDITQVQEKLPLISGKMSGLISAFFDEVYFCESEVQSNGTQKFTLKTKATPSMRQAKSRWGVPDGTETSYEAVAKYFALKPA